jgi:hypothetical protein
MVWLRDRNMRTALCLRFRRYPSTGSRTEEITRFGRLNGQPGRVLVLGWGRIVDEAPKTRLAAAERRSATTSAASPGRYGSGLRADKPSYLSPVPQASKPESRAFGKGNSGYDPCEGFLRFVSAAAVNVSCRSERGGFLSVSFHHASRQGLFRQEEYSLIHPTRSPGFKRP